MEIKAYTSMYMHTRIPTAHTETVQSCCKYTGSFAWATNTYLSKQYPSSPKSICKITASYNHLAAPSPCQEGNTAHSISTPSHTDADTELQFSTFQTKVVCRGGILAAWVSSSSSEAALPSGKVPLSGPDLLWEHNTFKPFTLSSNHGTYARGSIYCGC